MQAVNSKRIIDKVMAPNSGPLDVMVSCNAFNYTPLRVEVFEAV